MGGKIQNEDIKTAAELVAAGATAASLPNDTKVWLTSKTKTLYQGIIDGDIGGGGGGKNYIANYNFESNATTSWSLFNTTLTSKIPTGSITAGASSITTFTTSGTTPLEKSYSLRVASSGAVTAGHGFITDAFTIDREDQAKVMGFSFYYQAVSGTMDFSGTSANTWAVYLYDVTNSAWIQPAGVYNLVQGSGIGIASGTFQTTSNSTQYRLAVLCITATSGAVEMKFDDFACGPQKVLQAPAMSDWSDYTPTLTNWTGTINFAQWRRVGANIEVRASITATGFTAGTKIRVSYPSGKTPTQFSGSCGSASYLKAGTSLNYYTGSVTVDPAVLGFEFCGDGTASTYTWGNGNPATNQATDQVHFTCSYPVVGWSSNTVSSADTDTRVVAMFTKGQPSGTPTSSATIVKFAAPASNQDTHAAYSASTGLYTVPVSGYYDIASGIRINGTFTTGSDYMEIYIFKNGANLTSTILPAISIGSAYPKIAVNAVKLQAGDTIGIYIASYGSSLSYDPSSNWFSIAMRSGPAVVQATETVKARYYATLPDTGNFASAVARIANFDTKDYDSHSAVTTGVNSWKFTAPVSGVYSISANITLTGPSFTPNQIVFVVGNFKNGTETTRAAWECQASGSFNPAVPYANSTTLKAGEIIQLQLYHNGTGAGSLAIGGQTTNWIAIERIGN